MKITVVLFAVAVMACGGGGTDTGDGDDDTPAGADAAPDVPVFPDAAPGVTTGTLVGNVTRSVAPMNGGVGHLYLAVFEMDPVANPMANLTPVAQTLVENADFSADGASVSYEIPGIPPKDSPYFVTAFLDDNGTVDATNPDAAGPDLGDLVSLEGFASPSVAVNRVGAVPFDIDLNLAMPF